MDMRGKYTDPPVPAEYAWIRKGVPVRTKDSLGNETIGLISEEPWFLKLSEKDRGDWYCRVGGARGGGFCEDVEPLGEVEAVVWCADLSLAPLDVQLVAQPVDRAKSIISVRRQTIGLWEELPRIGQPRLCYGPESFACWAFPLRGPQS